VATVSDRSGLLVLKIRRFDDGAAGAPRFIVTATSTLDLSTREETQVTARSAEEVMDIVTRWIDAFLCDDGALTEP
jgi:hypothetical protein